MANQEIKPLILFSETGVDKEASYEKTPIFVG